MAYNRYRLKINDTVFNDSYIEKGSYSCEEAQRVVRAWTDANGIDHEEYAPTMKAEISFVLREHNSEDHATMMALINGTSDVQVEFYNDRTDSYRTGTFYIKTRRFSHMNLGAEGIIYNGTSVTLTER